MSYVPPSPVVINLDPPLPATHWTRWSWSGSEGKGWRYQHRQMVAIALEFTSAVSQLPSRALCLPAEGGVPEWVDIRDRDQRHLPELTIWADR